MKVLSANMPDLGERAKMISLKRLVVLDNPDLLFVQELMGHCDLIIEELVKLLPAWSFRGIDDLGLSRGLITGFDANFVLLNYFSLQFSLFTKLFNKEMDRSFIFSISMGLMSTAKFFGTSYLIHIVFDRNLL
jgi:hypothetical protein